MVKPLIEQYDNPDTLILISPYPKKGELYSTGTSGVASYSKNIATHLSRRVIILADYEKSPSIYEEKNVLVVRCYKKSGFRMWFQLLKTISSIKYAKKVLIQFDLALYHETALAFILPFLAILRFRGFKAFVNLHSIVRNVFRLGGHLGLKTNLVGSFKGTAMNLILAIFYWSVGFLSTKVIVAEQTLKNKLSLYVPLHKITAIAHGVDEHLSPVSKQIARRKLGLRPREFVVMFFGFVNWYKGADFFVDTYRKTKKLLTKKVSFIIAGGKSATLNKKKYYQNYYKRITYFIDKSKTMRMTGFVPQNKISLYFSAADLVVLPYRHYMAASGVTSLVFSYQVPFIISDELREMFTSEDIKDALNESDLKLKDVSFALNKEACLTITRKVLRNGIKNKMRKLCFLLKEKRSWKNTAPKFDREIFAPSYVFTKSPALRYLPEG